jgi:nicotinate-nucleotide adenylyltransferase
MDNRKVVIFGGAFSPPTLAHEAISAALLHLPDFDEVWVMPSGDRIDKHMSARDHDRMAMLERVQKERFADEPRLKITDFELRMSRPSKTYDTLTALEKTFPGTEFWFAYGPDSYVSMPNWPSGKKLQQKVKVVLFSSGGPKVTVHGPVIRLDIPDKFGDTSSTMARRLAAEGAKDFGRVVSQPVADYIQEHSLYAK